MPTTPRRDFESSRVHQSLLAAVNTQVRPAWNGAAMPPSHQTVAARTPGSCIEASTNTSRSLACRILSHHLDFPPPHPTPQSKELRNHGSTTDPRRSLLSSSTNTEDSQGSGQRALMHRPVTSEAPLPSVARDRRTVSPTSQRWPPILWHHTQEAGPEIEGNHLAASMTAARCRT